MFGDIPLVARELESVCARTRVGLYRIREYLPEDSARHVDLEGDRLKSDR